MVKQRYALAEKAAWAEGIASGSLALLKGIAGFATGSAALISDAAYTVSGLVSAQAGLAGLQAAKGSHDDGKTAKAQWSEQAAAMVGSAVLLVAGLETGFSAARKMASGLMGPPHWSAVPLIIFFLAARELLSRLPFGHPPAAGAKASGFAARRMETYAAFLALAGVAGALLGGIYEIKVLYYADGAAALAISLMTLFRGYSLAKNSIGRALTPVLHEAEIDELVKAAQCVKGVVTVDSLSAWEHGHYVMVDLKISVNPRITVWEGQEIAKTAKAHLLKRFIHVSDVLIQVNPYDPGYPYKSSADSDQEFYPPLLH